MRWFVICAVLAVAACGDAEAAGPKSATELAGQLGCSFTAEEPTLYASEEGPCGDVRVVWFNGSETRDQWLEIAQSFGGMYLVGDQWIVSADAREPLEQAKVKVGGEIR